MIEHRTWNLKKRTSTHFGCTVEQNFLKYHIKSHDNYYSTTVLHIVPVRFSAVTTAKSKTKRERLQSAEELYNWEWSCRWGFVEHSCTTRQTQISHWSMYSDFIVQKSYIILLAHIFIITFIYFTVIITPL